MTATAELKVLVPGDEAKLFEFLAPYLDTSLFFPERRPNGRQSSSSNTPNELGT